MKEKWNDISVNAKFSIIVICLLILLALLLTLFGPRKEKLKYSSSDFNKLEKAELNDYNMFNLVDNKINLFLEVSNADYTYDLLDLSYIKNNEVSINNVLKKTNKENHDLRFHLKKAYKIRINNDIVSYYALGYLYDMPINDDSQTDDSTIKILDKNYGILFTVDYKNMTTSFYPKLDNQKVLKVLNNKKYYYIDKNDSNALTETNLLTDYHVCSIYYRDIVFKIKNLKEESYSNLNKDSVNRFKSKDDYYNYLDKYYSEYLYSFKDCKKDSSGKEYYIYDTEGNEFKVYVKGVLDYTFVIP